MTPIEAITLLDHAASFAQGNRGDHLKAMEAKNVLLAYIEANTPKPIEETPDPDAPTPAGPS